MQQIEAQGFLQHKLPGRTPAPVRAIHGKHLSSATHASFAAMPFERCYWINGYQTPAGKHSSFLCLIFDTSCVLSLLPSVETHSLFEQWPLLIFI